MMRRALATLLTIASLSMAASALAQRAPEPVLDVETRRAEGSGWLVRLTIEPGFALNTRVPADRRLTLTSGERAWSTGDFETRQAGASVRTDGAHPAHGTLTAYVCREDLCKKITEEIRFIEPTPHEN